MRRFTLDAVCAPFPPSGGFLKPLDNPKPRNSDFLDALARAILLSCARENSFFNNLQTLGKICQIV